MFEAATFEGSFGNGVWDMLPSIATPTLVVTGVVEGDQPSRFASAVAERLPNGTYLELPHMTHFGPFTHIAESRRHRSAYAAERSHVVESDTTLPNRHLATPRAARRCNRSA